MGVATVCHADEWDTFNLRARVTHNYDSNVFRVSDEEDVNVEGETSKSDRITGFSVGADIDKSFGMQRFKLGGLITRNYYAVHNFLDHTNKDYHAAWEWSLTPRITGTLSTERVQRLADPAISQDLIGERNQVTVKNHRFDVDWWAHSNWHLLAGIGRDERQYDEELEEDRSSSARRWQLGVRYDRGTGRHVTVALRKREGDWESRELDPANFRDNEFEETEYGVIVGYAFGGDSRINARLAYLDHDEPHVNARDFDGWTGEFRAEWGLTAKLNWNLGYEFDLRPWQNEEASYADLKTWSTGLRWGYTAKQDLELRLEYRTKDHKGRLPTANEPPREDRSKSAGLYWTWKPNLTTVVNAEGTYTRRDSNIEEKDYDVYGVGMSVFQTF